MQGAGRKWVLGLWEGAGGAALGGLGGRVGKASSFRALPPPEGYYLHMDSSAFHPGGVARLRSPLIWEQGPLCVRFAYYMFGLSWGAQLKLWLASDAKGKHPNLLWKHMNTQSPSWIPTAVTVPLGLILPSRVRLQAESEVPVGIWVLGGGPGGGIGAGGASEFRQESGSLRQRGSWGGWPPPPSRS